MKVVRTLNKQVLVEVVTQKEETSAGGIVLPHASRSSAKQGIVRVAANGLEVQPGDRVLFSRHAATVDVGSGCELLAADDVLAVVA